MAQASMYCKEREDKIKNFPKKETAGIPCEKINRTNPVAEVIKKDSEAFKALAKEGNSDEAFDLLMSFDYMPHDRKHDLCKKMIPEFA